jgi:bla regulator protein BlaR1
MYEYSTCRESQCGARNSEAYNVCVMRQRLAYGSRFAMVAVCVAVFSTFARPRRSGQPTNNTWETAAGGKMAFEVASVKRSAAGDYHANFSLTLGSNFAQVGSLMSVDMPLRSLIGFAYKLSAGQMHFFISGLPDWVDSEWFDVEARAPISNPSKDQFRLMMQSLLASRFKLAMHEEERQLPIYALVLTKPGHTGPQLRPHVDDAKCGGERRADAPPAPAEFADLPCGFTLMEPSSVPGRVRGGGRDVDLDYIAAFLTGTGFRGTAPDRPVVNRTGLTGDYDFSIEFVPDANALPNGVPPDPNGPSFPEALEDQLGLKLKAIKGPVDVLVVDHIEEPTAN